MALVTVDTTSAFDSILAFAGPLAGVIVGAVGSWRVARSRDTKTEKLELTRALANYMAAAELVAVELDSFPEDSWLEKKIDQWLPVPRRGIAFTQRILARLAFGRQHEELRLRYQQARAELVLIAPIEIIVVVTRIDEFFIEWQTDRGEEMKRKWVGLSDGLRLTAQLTVDKGRGRPYRAGQPPTSSAPETARGWRKTKPAGGFVRPASSPHRQRRSLWVISSR